MDAEHMDVAFGDGIELEDELLVRARIPTDDST
jgi:hypothetical protein